MLDSYGNRSALPLQPGLRLRCAKRTVLAHGRNKIFSVKKVTEGEVLSASERASSLLQAPYL